MNRLVLLACVALASCDPAPTITPPVVEDPPSPSEEETDAPCLPVGPDRLHRLTARELGFTLQDLLSEPLHADVQRALDRLPPDDVTAGFDGIGRLQFMSLLHLEAFEALALAVADRVLARGAWAHRVELEELGVPADEVVTLALTGDALWWRPVRVPGLTVEIPYRVPAPGEYEVRVRAGWVAGQDAGPDVLQPAVQVFAGPMSTEPLPVSPVVEDGEALVGRLALQEVTGSLRVEVRVDSNATVALDWVEVVGPFDPVTGELVRSPSPLSCALDDARDTTCVARTLASLGELVWRRPLSTDELNRLFTLYAGALTERATHDEALHLVVQALLLSPSFHYRVEQIAELGPGELAPLPPWELASRLSYLVWSSMPDAELRACAASGELAVETLEGACTVQAQLARMVRDPRAERAFLQDFATQWLELDRLTALYRDPARYPDFPDDLGEHLLRGTHELLRNSFSGSEDLHLLFDGIGSVWVDQVTAPLYGAPRPGPGELAEAEVPAGRPDGLLGDAGVLALTSHADRSSPTLRGRWVLAHLLCAVPGPPAPGVTGLPAEPLEDLSVIGLIEGRLGDPNCGGCHQTMDRLGLALEGFDAVGASRTHWPDGAPVTPGSTLPDGTTLTGAEDLAAWVAGHEALDRCLVEHLTTWAHERVVRASTDRCLVEGVIAQAEAGGWSWSALWQALGSSTAATHAVGQEAP
jgi:hypothetical protein